MFTIDLTLKTNPVSLSVQRKTVEDAEALYQKITAAMRSNQSEILELTCDRQPEKKIGILSDQISAIQISQKSSSAASGKPPGFFAAE
jgi:hypothetical protein